MGKIVILLMHKSNAFFKCWKQNKTKKMNPQDVFFITTSSIIPPFVHLHHWGFPTLYFCCKKKSCLLFQVAHMNKKYKLIWVRGKQPATALRNPFWSASLLTSILHSAMAGLPLSQRSLSWNPWELFPWLFKLRLYFKIYCSVCLL